MMHAITIILSALVLCSGLDNNPIRNTKYGKIRGRVTTRLPGTEVEEFLGVPYAAPPIKALRFKVGLFLCDKLDNCCFSCHLDTLFYIDFA